MERLLRNTAAVAVGLIVAILTAVFGVRTTEITPRANPPHEIAATIKIKWVVNDGNPKGREAAIKQVRHVMSREAHRGEGYRFKKTAWNSWSSIKRLSESLKILEHNMRQHTRIGDRWIVVAVRDKFTMELKKVDVNPAKIVNTPGTQPIDIVVGTVRARFGNVPVWGICDCRHVKYSSSWSQHAFCNAVDFGGDVTRLNNVANYLYSLAKKDYVPIAQLLWKGRDMFTGHGVYNHFNHVHVSGKPLRGGTPTCAR